MSVLITVAEALWLKALASGEVRFRVKRKQYVLKRVVEINSFGFTVVLERLGKRSTHKLLFTEIETNAADLERWLNANHDRLDEYADELREFGVHVRAQ